MKKRHAIQIPLSQVSAKLPSLNSWIQGAQTSEVQTSTVRCSGISRRDFIRVVSMSGSGLLLAFHIPAIASINSSEAPSESFEPNAFLRIDKDGRVTITVARSEMGQGVLTSIPMLIAEELEADWSKIRVEQAMAHPQKYGSMITGGSSSVRLGWEPLRKAGATAREMLIAAATQIWGVDRSTCRADNGAIIHAVTGKRLSYGELVETASRLPVPENVPLKDSKDFRIIGKRMPRLDSVDKISGKATYGIDVKVSGMLIATVARSQVIGAKVRSFDAAKAKTVRGVRDVVQIQSGVAVVADSTWAAIQGRNVLVIDWDEGPNKNLSSSEIRKMFEEKSKEEGVAARKEGDFASAFTSALKKLEAVYELPFLAHTPLEPMNCVADIRSDRAEVWAPSQTPQWAQETVSRVAGLPVEKIMLHVPLLGGGFGRRLMYDYASEAAQVSKAVGAPVKLVWTREDDMTHDFYRPASYHNVAAGIDAEGRLTAWKHHITAPSIMAQLFPEQPLEGAPDAVDGAAQIEYQIPNILVDYVMANTPVPVMWWRSVYNSQNPFVNESFIDEIAHATNADPFDLRRKLLPETSRLRGVLELAAQKAGWGRPLPARWGHGIAGHFSFGSYVAQVAEVSVSANWKVKVHRIVCAVDCGHFVNPDTIEAQMEGGIIFGLSAAMRGEITIEKGTVVQKNFNDYNPLRIDEIPSIEVHIQKSSEAPGGIGEPGVPPVAPAVCNAIFAATGKRIRKLPIMSSNL
ncbi:MAG: xanthine dehydrogenase family protein molybdopterin-binding subunit [Acidobacteriota bacterium]